MKVFLKSIAVSLILLVSCGKAEKKENQDVPENNVVVKKERKNIKLSGLTYSSTFDKDEEGEFEEVNAFSHDNDRFNKENGSTKLDGISDYISIENHEELNPTDAITISVWYKPDSFKGNGNNSILNKGSESDAPPYTQYAFAVTGDQYSNTPGTFKFFLSINGTFRSLKTKPNSLSSGKWHLLTGTFDGKKMSFYVNDQLINNRNVEGKIDNYNTPLLIGKTPHKDFYTSGSIDDFMLFNRALTQEEIAQLYNNR